MNSATGKGMKVFYYMRRFWEIPGVERVLLFKATGYYFYYSIIVILFPMKSYFNIAYAKKGSANIIIDPKIISLIKLTIRRLCLIIPWKINCLIKSLVFKKLSSQLNIDCRIELEVFKDSLNVLKAHAFIVINEQPIFLSIKSSKGVLLFNNKK